MHIGSSGLLYWYLKYNVCFLDMCIYLLELGRGKKDKKQVKTAMNKYNSSHGIIISNTTSRIYKEDDIIHIPYRTFSLI